MERMAGFSAARSELSTTQRRLAYAVGGLLGTGTGAALVAAIVVMTR